VLTIDLINRTWESLVLLKCLQLLRIITNVFGFVTIPRFESCDNQNIYVRQFNFSLH